MGDHAPPAAHTTPDRDGSARAAADLAAEQLADSACTCTRGATATETDVPFVPGATTRNVVLACRLERAARSRRPAPDGRARRRSASVAGALRPSTFAARATTVTRLAVEHMELLADRLSEPIENQVERRSSARATRSPLRRRDATRGEPEVDRVGAPAVVPLDPRRLDRAPEPEPPRQRFDGHLYGPQSWCGE